jgi:hypothetical protein
VKKCDFSGPGDGVRLEIGESSVKNTNHIYILSLSNKKVYNLVPLTHYTVVLIATNSDHTIGKSI